ncbi:hypothetical protein ACOSQ3_015211 [Xanthoceras sorbifolium]
MFWLTTSTAITSLTPYSTLLYFSSIACSLLSTWRFVALTTANEFPENLAIWKMMFICCFASSHQTSTAIASLTRLTTLFFTFRQLLLSTPGFVALTTANELPENLAIWRMKFFCCCTANAEAICFG